MGRSWGLRISDQRHMTENCFASRSTNKFSMSSRVSELQKISKAIQLLGSVVTADIACSFRHWLLVVARFTVMCASESWLLDSLKDPLSV